MRMTEAARRHRELRMQSQVGQGVGSRARPETIRMSPSPYQVQAVLLGLSTDCLGSGPCYCFVAGQHERLDREAIRGKFDRLVDEVRHGHR
jgi:hypothetical protein